MPLPADTVITATINEAIVVPTSRARFYNRSVMPKSRIICEVGLASAGSSDLKNELENCNRTLVCGLTKGQDMM